MKQAAHCAIFATISYDYLRMTRCRGVSHRVTGSALRLLTVAYDFVQSQTVMSYRRVLNIFKLFLYLVVS